MWPAFLLESSRYLASTFLSGIGQPCLCASLALSAGQLALAHFTRERRSDPGAIGCRGHQDKLCGWNNLTLLPLNIWENVLYIEGSNLEECGLQVFLKS